MEAVWPSILVDRLQWRYAVKKFDPTKPIRAEVWEALERALVLAPSSFGLQPWRFLVVDDPVVRAKLLPASWGQRQVVDAARLVVFAIKKGLGADDVNRYVRRIAEVRGVQPASLDGFRDMMLGFVAKPGFDVDAWSARQTYIAIGSFLTAAALLGVDACPMEGIVPAQYDEILGLDKQGYHAVAVCTAGYRAADDGYASVKKVRFEDGEVVVHV
jgi:nitroreductase